MTRFETLSVLSQFLGAAGTLLAVIVALYMARKDRRIDLDISSGIYGVHSQNVGKIGEVIKFTIINRGHTPAHIANLSWNIGFIRRLKALQLFNPDSPLNSPLPIILKEAEIAQYSILTEDFDKVVIAIGKKIRTNLFIKRKGYFKISVNLFGHKSIKVPIDQAISNLIIKALKNTG